MLILRTLRSSEKYSQKPGHDVYLYEQTQTTLTIMSHYKIKIAHYGYVISFLEIIYRSDRTGNGYCDKDYMMRYLWREVKEKFRDDVVVCGSQTFFGYRSLSITMRVLA